MKSLFLSFICLLFFVSCQKKIDRPSPALSQEQIDRINSQQPTPPPAAATGSLQHYYCPNNCEGSGGDAAGTCPVCGSAYVHNAAFHNQPSATTTTDPAISTSTESTGATGAVMHYICPNGHAHGGDGAGTCPECGAEYIHNQAFHNQPSTPTPAASDPASVTIPPATSSAAEPPQNAAGVWHYICPNGHAGGGGGPTACPECGSTLVHNSAYHN